jgi:hypothetical protein
MFVVAPVPATLAGSAVVHVASVDGHLRVFGITQLDWLLGHGTVNVIMGLPVVRLPGPAVRSGRFISVIPHVALTSLEVRSA